MIRPASASIIVRPDSHDEVRKVAQELLRRARAIGVFPTPVDNLIAAVGIEELSDVESARHRFLEQASDRVRATFASAWAKIRGFADLVRRTTYSAPDATDVQKRWVRLHELGHQTIPWQRIRLAYSDDSESLSPLCEEAFDREANDFASELLFQGERFPSVAKSAGSTMESVFNFANKYGASRHATTRRFAEEAREAALLITYYGSAYTVDSSGMPELRLGKGHSASPEFLERYSGLQLPQFLHADDPWAAARVSGLVAFGDRSFDCGDGTTETFQWEAWWNCYRLLVLLWKPQGWKVLRLR
jgi:hypothetical protein